MQKVDVTSSAQAHERCMKGVCSEVVTRPFVKAPLPHGGIYPCVSNAGYQGVSGNTPTMTAQDRLVDAVVGAVTAVIDVVVAVLERAKGDRGTPYQMPTISKPIFAPRPTGSIDGGKPPFAPNTGNAPVAAGGALEAIQDDAGAITVRTSDGYAVRAQGSASGWSITSPDGKTTRFSAGQEARESDGDRWRSKGRGSFVFGSNKVTVEAKPLSNSASGISRVTVYSGAERVTIVGLDSSRPTILGLVRDGRQHDDALSDGTLFYRTGSAKGEAWSVIENGKGKVMGAK